jgi:hypothetical protein
MSGERVFKPWILRRCVNTFSDKTTWHLFIYIYIKNIWVCLKKGYIVAMAFFAIRMEQTWLTMSNHHISFDVVFRQSHIVISTIHEPLLGWSLSMEHHLSPHLSGWKLFHLNHLKSNSLAKNSVFSWLSSFTSHFFLGVKMCFLYLASTIFWGGSLRHPWAGTWGGHRYKEWLR